MEIDVRFSKRHTGKTCTEPDSVFAVERNKFYPVSPKLKPEITVKR